MKYTKLFIIAGAAVLALSCSKMDEILPQSGTYTESQVQEINATDPTRAEAVFSGMFTKLGKPCSVFGTSSDRPDDWGFPCICLSNDLEGADAVFPNNNYNWFSVCGEYTSRTPSYANPYIRYAAPYNTIADANSIILQFPDDLVKVAQAKALRAYAYMALAPFFQGRYVDCADLPCVPIITEKTTDFTQNPRASVKDVYDLVITDLTEAIEVLDEAGDFRTNKSKIDGHVAHGLRARAYLTMGKYDEAYADAEAAAKGYTPATIEEVSKPSFKDITEHNWIWGYDMTPAVAAIEVYATSTSWMRSFSADGYGPATGTYLCCNKLLYDKIPETDVRKGWWVNEDLESPLLEGLSWSAPTGEVATGQDLPWLEITDVKLKYLPYTNVKFGCYSVATTTNEEDFPLMRVEEMILIQAECLANTNKIGNAAELLSSFLTTYRDPSYAYDATARNFADEVWFQRRVELWGEGFFVPDARRLNKPIVRTHGPGTTNQPDAFAFNIAPDDPWLNMRFSDAETNTNFAIIDNEGGSTPKANQNSELRDGVTD